MAKIEKEQFEKILNEICDRLKGGASVSKYPTSKDFERAIRIELEKELKPFSLAVDFDPHPHIFPDICIEEYGIEIKHTTKDTWRSVANSILESTRDKSVKFTYVVFAKLGGEPDIKWGVYEDCVIHVRTSHVPRFEVELGAKKSLFSQFGISYEKFSSLPIEEKMTYVRKYARDRLKKGERLWWLEDADETPHALDLQVRLYMNLEQGEKRKLRAEGIFLCPQIFRGSRARNKYNDVVMYILTYHGVLCPQARDLFSAGSVALRADAKRGGNYILRAVQDLENEILAASDYLDDALLEEYWGFTVSKEKRLASWLEMADKNAKTWKPSESLFTN